MAKDSISAYSSTAASNTDVGGVDIQGSAAASNMDDALREIMSHLADAAFGTSLSLTSTDAGATVGPTIDLYRNSATPAVNDVMGGITFSGEDSAGNKTTFGNIEGVIEDPTNGSEDGIIRFRVVKGGTLADAFSVVPGGITVEAASGPTANTSVVNTDSNANVIILQGGETASIGGQVFAYGSTHATAASDIAFFSAGVERYRYAASAGRHNFAASVETGTFSTTGASNGKRIQGDGSTWDSSRTVTTSVEHLRFYNPNGQVGSITSSGSSMALNSASDHRLKKNFRTAPDPGTTIDQIEIYEFDWKADGTKGVGPKAQELYAVFPEAVAPGRGEPGQPDFMPWCWDASKLVPLLVREVQLLRKRVAGLEKSGPFLGGPR